EAQRLQLVAPHPTGFWKTVKQQDGRTCRRPRSIDREGEIPDCDNIGLDHRAVLALVRMPFLDATSISPPQRPGCWPEGDDMATLKKVTKPRDEIDITRKIWLAGVGAYGRVFAETQGALEKLAGTANETFDQLVATGEKTEDAVRARIAKSGDE